MNTLLVQLITTSAATQKAAADVIVCWICYFASCRTVFSPVWMKSPGTLRLPKDRTH